MHTAVADQGGVQQERAPVSFDGLCFLNLVLNQNASKYGSDSMRERLAKIPKNHKSFQGLGPLP